jgi:hypothetical protein
LEDRRCCWHVKQPLQTPGFLFLLFFLQVILIRGFGSLNLSGFFFGFFLRFPFGPPQFLFLFRPFRYPSRSVGSLLGFFSFFCSLFTNFVQAYAPGVRNFLNLTLNKA